MFYGESTHMTEALSHSVGIPQAALFGDSGAASSARLLLCSQCSAMVLVCRACDRGQRYCGLACSTAARKQAQREAAQRYQSGPTGRAVHAGRSRRWRERQRVPENEQPAVTHQGGTAGSQEVSAAPHQSPQAPPPPSTGLPLQLRCICCYDGVSQWMRWGPLRHRRRLRRCRKTPTATLTAGP